MEEFAGRDWDDSYEIEDEMWEDQRERAFLSQAPTPTVDRIEE